MIAAPEGLSLTPLAPALTLLITASVALLVGVWTRDARNGGALALLGLIAAAVFASLELIGAGAETTRAFGLQWLSDAPAAALSVTVLVGAFLSVLLGWDALAPAGMDRPEYHPLMLLATTGALVMIHAGDFVTLILGLEILSLSVYALSAWRSGDHGSEEAGMKYFLLGAFASAILIYGMALLYGATGDVAYVGIAADLQDGVGPLALMGGMLVLVGLAFKVSFAPFHQWAPDVYTGAPTPVTAFMSVVVKAAAFGALVRVFAEAWPGVVPEIEVALAALVALTLIVGNFGALLQSGVKRMLAYSAVAHAGYLGLAVLAAGQDAIGPQVRRPHAPQARPGDRDDAVPAEPGGHSAPGRLLRQVPGRAGRLRGRLRRRGRAGADHRRRGRRLLPAGRLGDGLRCARHRADPAQHGGRLGHRRRRGRHRRTGPVPGIVVRPGGGRAHGALGGSLIRPSSLSRSFAGGRPARPAPARDA